MSDEPRCPHCDTPIDEHEIGLVNGQRCLDMWVGEAVFGGLEKNEYDEPIVPRYSTDIAAAWEVAKRLYEFWGGFHLDRYGDKVLVADRSAYLRTHTPYTGGEAATVPLAICRAAIKAVEG